MRRVLLGLTIGLTTSSACGGDDEPACDCAEVGCFAEMCTKTVFVTSTAITSNFGGIAAADALCAQEAAAAGLPGTYYAWLSDKTNSPLARFAHSEVPYVLPDGTVIAADWDGLAATAPPPISLHANGSAAPPDDGAPAQVWTGTTIDGHADNFNNASNFCLDWTDNSISNQTLIGWVHARMKQYDWTRANLVPCTGSGYLYCFQQ